jgi:hypothetical protein
MKLLHCVRKVTLHFDLCGAAQSAVYCDHQLWGAAQSAVYRDHQLWGAAQSAVYRDHQRTLNELKTAITAYIRNISQADLQKGFVNKIKRLQACIDARRHHFQHLL